MKIKVIGMLIFLFCAQHGLANNKHGIAPVNSSWNLSFLDSIGERYRVLKISKGDKLVRELNGSVDGDFEKPGQESFSPDGEFLVVYQVISGNVEEPGIESFLHEVSYCNMIRLSNGCIIFRTSGIFCAGEFSPKSEWVEYDGSTLSLSKEAPSIKGYADMEFASEGSPVYSLDNLLACDPISKNNVGDYQRALERGLFGEGEIESRELVKKIERLMEDLYSSSPN